ncbi:hypothetical protein OKJ48_11970 [Streptomyces kunmingensis]|uniref:Secreted protein n=1 Tax=Streptomyces kunmingensis TaxID=68225 RepID=A0ABU6C8L7_9ACTN|nr:hypothetical protein [Streptomyces kunmingensis]MEB3960957.1 hypothetical protein [Streptomyces kunmingensis]
MRRTRLFFTGLLLACTSLTMFTGAAIAAGDDGDGDDGAKKAPTEAGTSFRTATSITQEQKATASASTGDYLYWSFPADSGQRPTVKATVDLPDAQTRHSGQTWRIDVYDGLRRRQACTYGTQARTVAADAARVDLACTLRTVRAWSEPWANDPLPGTYYVRLTVTGLADSDLGLPVSTSVEAVSEEVGGAAAVDGSLSTPLVPGSTGAADDHDWASGWWTSRWLWTGAGAVLAALAGIGGYALTRGTGRPTRVPPAV